MMRRCLLLWLSLVLMGLSVACGNGRPARLGGAEITGQVTARAEGYADRPGWADANDPWSRQGDGLRIVGYVAIRGDQRMEAGYRAADSYARAELVRFLSVRVVSVLEDQVKTGEPEKLRERIEVTAQSWVDELTVAQRYWERRKTGSDEKVHIWSRLDIDQSAVAELLQRAMKDASDLRTPVPQLLQELKARWNRVADVKALNQGDPSLPPDVAQPPWAKNGDRASDAGFEFVCHGLAKDEKTARALAQARCNEKLCRIFGVQISAKSRVVENLDGVTAESEVSEQCANVRVVGRETRYQGGECGPHGCVQWIMQAYPRAAYEEEKQRLDKPTVIQQQVVIQEGGKKYRDPAACEASLRSYAAVRGQDAPAFETRRQHLQQAIRVCQDIDGRDSGLFLSLYTILTQPLSTFTVDAGWHEGRGPVNTRFAFTIASPEWHRNLETLRFLTDRISSVLKLVSEAILPLRILDIRDKGGDANAVDAVIREVVKYPFVSKPLSEHHQYYIHDMAMSLGGKRGVPYSERYRKYLIDQVEKQRLGCVAKDAIGGAQVLEYLTADGKLDDREWQLGLRFMNDSELDRSDDCFEALFYKVDHGAARAQHIEQIAQAITSGAFKVKDMARTFKTFIDRLEKPERGPLFLRYRTKLTGNADTRGELVRDVLEASFGWNWDWQNKKKDEGRQQCETMANRIGTFFADVPEAKAKYTGLCLCLRLEGLSSTARKGITSLLFQYGGDEECNEIHAEDWPEEYYSVQRPKTIPYSGRPPFSGHLDFLEPEFKQCIDRHSVIEHPHMVSYVTATIAAGRFSNAKVETTIYGELKTFSYREKRRGYVRARDVYAMKENIETCMRNAANQFQVPALYSITKESRPQRLWFQFWDANVGANGFVE